MFKFELYDDITDIKLTLLFLGMLIALWFCKRMFFSLGDVSKKIRNKHQNAYSFHIVQTKVWVYVYVCGCMYVYMHERKAEREREN